MKPVRVQCAFLIVGLALTACSTSLATALPEQIQTQVAQALAEKQTALASTPFFTLSSAAAPTSSPTATIAATPLPSLTLTTAATPTSSLTPTIAPHTPTSSPTPIIPEPLTQADTPNTTIKANTPSDCIVPPGAGTCARILFIGNSYTYTNDLPTVFTDLAMSGGHPVVTGMDAEGGWTLANHASSSTTLDALKSSQWEVVVLQEQSEIPASELDRTESMYPAARLLVRQIENLGATPLFFQTWAHQSGWPEAGLPDYQSMQTQIDQGYQGIAQELHVGIAPVGYAWSIAKEQDPDLDLWQDDGSHPDAQGTYLAACVFYATIFRQSPQGLTFLDQLPEATSQLLQTIAADAVLADPQEWDLP
jgi:hypothetical protein